MLRYIIVLILTKDGIHSQIFQMMSLYPVSASMYIIHPPQKRSALRNSIRVTIFDQQRICLQETSKQTRCVGNNDA